MPQNSSTSTTNNNMNKISTCTMTGKSLNNLLDECPSSTSSEEKAVQTTSHDFLNGQSLTMKRAISNTSLSSSSATSIPTDSHEKKSPIPSVAITSDTQYKWPHHHQRLLGEQNCTYWVNYLGKFVFFSLLIIILKSQIDRQCFVL